MKVFLVLCVILVNLALVVSSFELRVCSAEDLRKSIEEVCIRFSRNKGSDINLNPYGSMVPAEDPIIESARSKRNYHSQKRQRLFKRHRERVTRDYVDTCCSRGCEIDTEDITSICSTV